MNDIKQRILSDRHRFISTHGKVPSVIHMTKQQHDQLFEEVKDDLIYDGIKREAEVSGMKIVFSDTEGFSFSA